MLKRLIDITVAFGGLVLLSPILLSIAIITRAFGKPTFIRRNGKLYFRPVHPIVQQFSIDELPQLIDVLMGRYSLAELAHLLR